MPRTYKTIGANENKAAKVAEEKKAIEAEEAEEAEATEEKKISKK